VRLNGFGIEIDLPEGWEGRIYRRPEGDPTLHAANFPLPVEDGDFGATALRSIGSGGVFIALTEYRHDVGGQGLFERTDLSLPLRSGDFSPAALQRTRPGQTGLQRFAMLSGRPFCLYAVVGARSRVDAHSPVNQANRVLATLSVAPTG
jgi:hypothetical protein